MIRFVENSLSMVALVTLAALQTGSVGWLNLQGTAAVYRLALINGVSPTDSALESACDVPLFDEYRIQGGQWWERVTFRGQGQCKPLPDGPSLTRVDSGVYRVRGDTLHFYSHDKRVGITKDGLPGWVMFGVLRGDTLLFPGGVFTPSDPGDMVYLRVR
jgi:hypothetical protein